MKKKKSFFDIIAAFLFINNIDWDEEYELLEVEDIMWESMEPRPTGGITHVTASASPKQDVG